MSRFDLGPGVNELKALLSAITDDDLHKPTPCPLFDVAAVVAHVGGVAQAFTAAAHKADSELVEQQPSPQPMPLTGNWRERIPRDLDALADAWRVPDAWTGTTRIAAQDAPAEMVAMTVADEIVVHTWDLARAIGQNFDADPALVRAAKEFLTAFTSPDAPAGDDVAFGPSRQVADGATDLEAVVSLAGRDPNWSPRR